MKSKNPDEKRIAEEVERRISKHLHDEVERRVSERLKEIEIKYSNSEEKYALAFQHSIAGMILARLTDGFVIEVNNQFLDMFGLDREDVLGKVIGPRVWKDPKQRQQMIDALEQHGQFLAQEVPFLRKTGEEWIGLVTSKRIVLQGEPVLISSIVNITDRVIARDEALASRAKLETALESLNDAVLIADAEGIITDFNESFAAFHGFQNKEECARSVDKFTEILETYLPDGTLAPLDQWVLPRALRGEKATNAEYTVRRRDTGTTWEGSYSFAPVCNGDDVIIGAVAVGRDITAQKRIKKELVRSEEQYRAIFEQAAVGIGRISFHDALLIEVNDTFSRMVGYTHEELQRTPWPQITHPDDLDLDLIPFRKMAAGKLESYMVKKRFIHKKGHHVWAKLTLSLVRNSKGLPDYEIAIIEDITKRKKAEKALLRRSKELAVVNRELEAFSYSVSHDLRAPLRAICGFSSLLRENAGQFEGKANEYLQRITAGAEKMTILIDDMLRLSSISRQEMFIQEIDLSAMAKDLFGELELQYPERHVETCIPNDLKARGDAQLISLALTNLIGNAWKYTGKTTEARVEFGSCRKNGKKVFFIRDNGAGFPMKQTDRLFKPFQRLHSESEFSGTGIGLPIVQKVINRHGGEIWAEGEVGKGAAFYFTLRP